MEVKNFLLAIVQDFGEDEQVIKKLHIGEFGVMGYPHDLNFTMMIYLYCNVFKIKIHF